MPIYHAALIACSAVSMEYSFDHGRPTYRDMYMRCYMPCAMRLFFVFNCERAEADLGMFSMFGRTGAPTKRGPPQEDRQIFVITKYSVNVG